MKNNQEKNVQRLHILGRRRFLQGASIAAASLALPRVLRGQGQISATCVPPPRHTLVCVNMRGAADGLTLLAPTGDQDYSLYRNVVALTAGDLLPSANLGNSYWKLPAGLNMLKPIFDSGDMAIVPATGLLNNNKSHFVAMDLLEFGIPPTSEFIPPPVTSGFVGRHLMNGNFTTEPPLRGMVLQKLGTSTFAEAPKSLAIADIDDFSFPGEQLMREGVVAMHDNEDDPLKAASETAFAAIDYLDDVKLNGPNPTGNYPASPLGDKFYAAAKLILHGDAPECIEIDRGGWDTHFNQGPNQGGQLYGLMSELAQAIAAFQSDVDASGNHDNVTTICFTEFGRRIGENNSAGTDHGRGGVCLVIGGRINGRIYDDDWTTQAMGAPSPLTAIADTQGDVTTQTDIRDVFAELFIDLMGLCDPKDVYFDGFVYTPISLVT